MTGICVDCGAITKGYGERCNSCANKKKWTDPEFIEKRAAAFARPECKQKMSDAKKKYWADPECRKQHMEMISSPEYVKRRSETTRSVMANPDVKQRHSDGIKAAHARGDYDAMYADPAYGQRQSEVTKAAHARGVYTNPEVMKRHSDGIKLALSDPEVKRRMSKAQKDAWASPERRRMRSEITKEQWADPAMRKKMEKSIKVAMEKPEVRQKVSDGVCDNWKKGCYDNCNNPSKLELSVLEALKAYGFECDDQFRHERCGFTYDILLVNYRTLIEVDGDYWHSKPGASEKDAEKDEWAVNNGFDIIRLPEHVINEEGLEAVVEQVVLMLEDTDG